MPTWAGACVRFLTKSLPGAFSGGASSDEPFGFSSTDGGCQTRNATRPMKTNKPKALQRCLLGLALVAATNAAISQNFIINGDFESPAIAPDSISFGATGWITSGNVYSVNGGGNNSLVFPGAPEGVQYAAVYPFSALSQTFNISSAGTYELNWLDSSMLFTGGLHTAYIVKVEYSLSVGGGYYNSPLLIPEGRGWTPHLGLIHLSPGSYTLSFERTGDGSPLLIDGVSLSAVPEPMEWTACVAFGLAGVAAFRRYSRR